MKKVIFFLLSIGLAHGGNVIVNSSNQYASPTAAQIYAANPPLVRSGILIAGFSGPFESGTEKGNIGFSTDGINFIPVFGLEKYSPPLDGSSRPVGIRDTHLIKIGNYYLVTSTATYAGGNLEPYFDVARSTDLINWVNVASVTPSVGGQASPAPFIDPATGNLYVVNGVDPTAPMAFTQNTSKDGVTWSGSALFTLAAGGNINGSDASVVFNAGTYYLFYKATDNNYHYATSSSFATGYTVIGLLGTSWPNAEGLCLIPTPEGIFRAYFNARSGALSGLNCYSTATSIAGTWSTPTLVPTGFAAAWDNASGIAVTDAGTFRDAQGAANRLLPYPINWDGASGQDSSMWRAQGNTQFINSPVTGHGTIAISGTTVTGTGTDFKSQVPQGSVIIWGSGGNRATVRDGVTSDTSLNLVESSGTVAAGTSYTVLPPIHVWGADNGTINVSGDGSLFLTSNFTGKNQSIILKNAGTNIPTTIGVDLNGNALIYPGGNKLIVGNSTSTTVPTQITFDNSAGGSNAAGATANLKLVLLAGSDNGLGLGPTGSEIHLNWGNALRFYSSGVLFSTMTYAGALTQPGLITGAGVTDSVSGNTLASRAPLASPTFTGNVTVPTLNGNTITTGSGTLTLGTGKTATVSNTLTFTGTDSSSVAFGAGGTVAYTSNNLSVFATTTSAQLAGIISDETGTGALVFGTSPTLAGDVTHSTGNIIFSTAGKGIVGGVTATLPTAGNVGSLLTNSVTPGSPVALTTATSATVCSQALPAGHYLVSFQATCAASGATMVLSAPMQAGISQASNTLPVTLYTIGNLGVSLTLASATNTIPLSTQEITLSAPATIYGVVNCTFTAGSVNAYGFLQVIQLP